MLNGFLCSVLILPVLLPRTIKRHFSKQSKSGIEIPLTAGCAECSSEVTLHFNCSSLVGVCINNVWSACAKRTWSQAADLQLAVDQLERDLRGAKAALAAKSCGCAEAASSKHPTSSAAAAAAAPSTATATRAKPDAKPSVLDITFNRCSTVQL